MNRLKKSSVLFAVGGVGYASLEMLWRGRTHWTMLLAGGVCFMMISRIADKFKKKSLGYKAFLCCVGITGVEFAFGMVFNRLFRMNVWDYSRMPFNFMGQICLLYTLLWGILGCACIPIAQVFNKKLRG